MFCVLFGTMIITLIATIWGYPISATHGVIGSLVSVGMITKGTGSIGWSTLGLTCVAWVTSPLTGAVVTIIV